MTKSEEGLPLYQRPGDYEALFNPGLQDLTFYLEVAKEAAGPVLELGCGSGRLLWPLRQAGVAIEGLDQSPAMLQACRDEGRRRGLSAPLHEADWRHFELGRPFAAILLPFNGLQHLCSAQDLEAFFDRLRAHLQPRGLFALDLHVPQAAILARDPGERFGVEEGPQTPQGERVIAEQSRYDALAQVLTQTWTLAGPDGSTREISLALRQFFPQELGALLRNAGFELQRLAGGYRGEPLIASSLRQAVCCRRL
jgi:SAM-dependent methyltransferase